MPKIKIDEVEYNTEDLSDNGKAQLASLRSSSSLSATHNKHSYTHTHTQMLGHADVHADSGDKLPLQGSQSLRYCGKASYNFAISLCLALRAAEDGKVAPLRSRLM